MAGTPAITATANAQYAYVTLTVTGLAGYDSLYVSRTNPDGSVVPVRGANPASVSGSGGTWSGIDYEAPLGQAVHYSITVATSAGDNVLANPGVENGLTEWSCSTSATIAQSSSFAHGGTYSAAVTPSGSAYSVYSPKMSTTPGWNWTVSGWALYGSGSFGTSFAIDWWDSSGTFLSTSAGTSLTVGNAWSQVPTLTAAAPANAATGQARYTLSGSPTSSQVGYFDDLSVSFDHVWNGPNGSSNTVTIPYTPTTAWLKNLSQSALSTKVTVSSLGDIRRPSRQQVYSVIGRQNFVVISDVRGGRTGTLTLLTTTSSDESNLKQLLDSGQTLFFQATPDDNFADLYLAPGDYTVRRPGVSTDATRLWEINYTEVDSPSGLLTTIPGNSYLTVMNFLSYQNLLNQRSTYLDVLNHAYGS